MQLLPGAFLRASKKFVAMSELIQIRRKKFTSDSLVVFKPKFYLSAVKKYRKKIRSDF